MRLSVVRLQMEMNKPEESPFAFDGVATVTPTNRPDFKRLQNVNVCRNEYYVCRSDHFKTL